MVVSLCGDTSLCLVLCWDHIGQLDKDDYTMIDGMMDGMMDRMMDGMMIGMIDRMMNGMMDGMIYI